MVSQNTIGVKTFDPLDKERLSRLLQYSESSRFDNDLRKQFLFACVFQERLHDAIRTLTAPLSSINPKNESCVWSFRRAQEDVVMPVCDALEKPDYETASKLIDCVISPPIPDWPEAYDNGYRVMSYRYGKVSEYCRSMDSDRDGEADQSCQLEGFVGKRANLAHDRMTRDEIWLLVSAAWDMESQECRRRMGKLEREPETILPSADLIESLLTEEECDK